MTSTEKNYHKAMAALDAATIQGQEASRMLQAARSRDLRSPERAAAWSAFHAARAALDAVLAGSAAATKALLAERLI